MAMVWGQFSPLPCNHPSAAHAPPSHSAALLHPNACPPRLPRQRACLCRQVFGSIMMVAVMMPLAYRLPGGEGEGLHEDSWDTLAMIKNSVALRGVLATDMLALLAYNM